MALMASALVWLLLAGPALAGSAQRRLQQQNVEGGDASEYDGVFTEQDTLVYQLVSQSQPNTLQNYDSSYTLQNITASLEMDTSASYSNTWRADDPRTWEAGNTRVNVSVLYGTAPPLSERLSAQLFQQVCGADGPPATAFENDAANASIIIPLTLSSTGGAASVVFPFLVDYDSAQSMVITNSEQQAVACCTLYPPMPDFPTEWSSLLESNSPTFGFTFLMQLYYSASMQKTRADFQGPSGSRVVLTDFANKNQTIVYPANATYPQGLCQPRPFGGFVNRFVDDESDLLVSSADFLFFNTTTAMFNEQQITVRGIECEQWVDSRTVQVGRNNTVNATFEVSYAFPINSWVVFRADYHRLLKQVYINGTTSNGSFESYNNYINFRPRNYSRDSEVFNVCALAPQGENCNCTREEVAQLVGLLLNQDSDVVDLNTSSSTTNDVCQAAIPHGFISQQAGPYVGLVIVGIVAGMMMMFTAMYVWYRARVGVGLTDKVGHSRFSDGL